MFIKSCLAVCALLTCINALPAEEVSDMYKHYDTSVRVDTDLTQGYRVDQVKWDISKNHSHRKLTYKNINLYQTRLRTQITKNDYFTKLMLGYGFARGGYKGGDYTTDAQIAFGKNFQITPNIILAPLAGYNWSYQKFQKTSHKRFNHRCTVTATNRATWNAPFIGAHATLKVTNNLDLFAEYNFLFANQYTDKGTFGHKKKHLLHMAQHSPRKNGFGHMGTIGTGYKFSTHCSLAAEYQLSYMHTHGGKVKSHLGHRHAKHTLSKASLLSSEVRVTFNYAF